ncbi:unnamed protein product [Leuciscus chuanchicus]
MSIKLQVHTAAGVGLDHSGRAELIDRLPSGLIAPHEPLSSKPQREPQETWSRGHQRTGDDGAELHRQDAGNAANSTVVKGRGSAFTFQCFCGVKSSDADAQPGFCLFAFIVCFCECLASKHKCTQEFGACVDREGIEIEGELDYNISRRDAEPCKCTLLKLTAD